MDQPNPDLRPAIWLEIGPETDFDPLEGSGHLSDPGNCVLVFRDFKSLIEQFDAGIERRAFAQLKALGLQPLAEVDGLG